MISKWKHGNNRKWNTDGSITITCLCAFLKYNIDLIIDSLFLSKNNQILFNPHIRDWWQFYHTVIITSIIRLGLLRQGTVRDSGSYCRSRPPWPTLNHWSTAVACLYLRPYTRSSSRLSRVSIGHVWCCFWHRHVLLSVVDTRVVCC